MRRSRPTRPPSVVPEAWFAIPGELTTLTGGYLYDRRVMAEMPAQGWTLRHLALPAGFPDPSAADLAETQRRLAALPAGSLVLADGLAYGALPRALIEASGHRWVALVHHPLALESGLPKDKPDRLRASERDALSAASAVVVTSPHTAATLVTDFGVARDRITVARPGTDRAGRAMGSDADPLLITVATLTARKGHDVLVDALARLKDLRWTSHFVGSQDRDPRIAADIAARIRRHGIEDRVRLDGELADDALERLYARSTACVLPSRYEGYGMAFADALVRGLPIVGCAAGAVTETVPAAASLLVPPDAPQALAEALRRLLSDGALRRRLADAAWEAGRKLPTWTDTARDVARALASVA
jgi:glycosyltransferase involved in cell wall biosynthesis